MLQEQTHWQDSTFNNASSIGTLHVSSFIYVLFDRRSIFYMETYCPVRLSYFSVMEQYFPLTTFQHKHQHKPNFSISEQGTWMTGIFLLRTPWHQLLKLGNKTFWSACLRVFLYVAVLSRCDEKHREPQFKWHTWCAMLISYCIIELLLWLWWWWSVTKDSRLSLYWPMVISCL